MPRGGVGGLVRPPNFRVVAPAEAGFSTRRDNIREAAARSLFLFFLPHFFGLEKSNSLNYP